MGFQLGADDYVSKPFSPRELMARVNAVLKLYNPLPRQSESICDILQDALLKTLYGYLQYESFHNTHFRHLER